jgi:hypothetical protein
MALNVSKEIASLKRMTLADLRRKYAEAFGESTTCRHKQFLVRRIIWRLQANEEGDLSERARQRAKELAADSDVRLTAPRARTSSSAGATKIGTIDIAQDGPYSAKTPIHGGELGSVRHRRVTLCRWGETEGSLGALL